MNKGYYVPMVRKILKFKIYWDMMEIRIYSLLVYASINRISHNTSAVPRLWNNNGMHWTKGGSENQSK